MEPTVLVEEENETSFFSVEPLVYKIPLLFGDQQKYPVQATLFVVGVEPAEGVR